jgi:hypothetical protein
MLFGIFAFWFFFSLCRKEKNILLQVILLWSERDQKWEKNPFWMN